MRYLLAGLGSALLSALCGQWLHHLLGSGATWLITIELLITSLFAAVGVVLGLWYSVSFFALGWTSIPSLSGGAIPQIITKGLARWGAPLIRRSATILLAGGLTLSGTTAFAQELDLGWTPTSEAIEIVATESDPPQAESTVSALSPDERPEISDQVAGDPPSRELDNHEDPSKASGQGSSPTDPMPSSTNPTPHTTEPTPHATNPTPGSASLAPDSHYVVKQGDSLWNIASQSLNPEDRTAANISWYTQQIYQINEHTIGSSADLIFPGQQLIIPPATLTTIEEES